MVRPRGTDKAEVIKVIKTKSLLGYGTQEDPVRLIYQYWDLNGNLLASHDTLDEAIDDSDMDNKAPYELPPHKFPLLNPREYQRIYKEAQQEAPKED